MSTLQHPHAELSAYIDRELPAAEQAAVEAHLATCPSCRAGLAELRATASLIARLPSPEPSRRLVPRLAPPAWLAPMRTLASIAAGVSAFLFVASVVVVNGPSGAPSAALDTNAARPAPVPAPQAGAPAGPGAATVPPTAFSAGSPPAAAQRGVANSDAAKRQDVASASPNAEAAQSSPAPIARTTSANETRSSIPSPWLWLALAALCSALAIALHRRLRSAA